MKRQLPILAKTVKENRRKLNITQSELARKAGVGLHFLRDLEQGKTNMNMAKVNQVLALFGKELAPVDVLRAGAEE